MEKRNRKLMGKMQFQLGKNCSFVLAKLSRHSERWFLTLNINAMPVFTDFLIILQ